LVFLTAFFVVVVVVVAVDVGAVEEELELAVFAFLA
jgi:hypothetical protein